MSEQFPSAGLESVDEELHVHSLNDHASAAAAQFQHNGPQHKLAYTQQAWEGSFLRNPREEWLLSDKLLMCSV